jgi:hypothetical protein
MAEHEFTAAGLLESMERRFSYLYTNELYNGQDAGEFDVLEGVLFDLTSDGDSEVGLSAIAASEVSGEVAGEGSGVSRSPAGSPRLLTGGSPCTLTPNLPGIEVPEFSHGGYDGGVMVGFEGTWDTTAFSYLLEILDAAKEEAGDAVKGGMEGLPLNLEGEEVLVSPKGGLAGGNDAKGGVVYKYRFFCQGVEFMIHSNPSEYIQPVRVRYGAESVQGHRNRFYDVHYGFVLPFLKRLGLDVKTDKLSRVDMQCLIDIPMSEFSHLLKAENKHVVTKLRKKSEHGTMSGRVETVEIGSVSNVQFCFYDKGRELRAKKSNIVKEALFIRDCVGDEWYNSGRPITRIEIRLGRDALKCLGIDSVSDLRERERGVIDLLTTEWLRILAEPKVRGHENTAAIHPTWERVRNLFFAYFTGGEVDVRWNQRESISCDPDALEKQALGCISKALAYRFGEQDSLETSVELGSGWMSSVGSDLHEKLNCCALQTRCKSGIEFGMSHNDELEWIMNQSRSKLSGIMREVVGR